MSGGVQLPPSPPPSPKEPPLPLPEAPLLPPDPAPLLPPLPPLLLPLPPSAVKPLVLFDEPQPYATAAPQAATAETRARPHGRMVLRLPLS